MLQRVDVIALALLHHGVAVGQHVAVLQEPTPDWICSLLGIMKIDAVYVPLDPSNRTARLVKIISDCEPTIILIDTHTRQRWHQLEPSGAHVLDISTLGTTAHRHVENLASQVSPAMILYTSGSTGNPKGIVITHDSLRNEIGAADTYGLESNVRVLQQSSPTFDMSVYQSLVSIALGGTLLIGLALCVETQ